MFVNGYDIVKKMNKGEKVTGIPQYESMVDLLVSAPDVWVLEAEFAGNMLISIKKSFTEEAVMGYLFGHRDELTSRINTAEGEKKVKFQAIEAMFFGDKQSYYSTHKDSRLRQIVANNGCFLDRLAKDKNRYVRAEARKNEHYEPNKFLTKLSRILMLTRSLYIPKIASESKERELALGDYAKVMAFSM